MSIIIKNQEQIDGIRLSSKLAAKTLKIVEPYIKPGVTTAFIDKIIHEFILDNGAVPAPLNYNGFPKSCCISKNDVICHGIPADNEFLTDGDIFNIDVTTILNGYYGDTSKMFWLGEISAGESELIKTAKHCLDLGIRQVYPKNVFGNIGYNIGRYAQAKGYSVVYEFCGHGVGINFHEDPQVDHIARKNTGPLIKPGMIFTIEPMINEGKPRVIIDKNDGWTARTIDGKLSAQFEHTILVTQTGHEVLTDIDNEYVVS